MVRHLPPLLAMGTRFVRGRAADGARASGCSPAAARCGSAPELGSAALVGVLLLTIGNGGVAVAEQTVPSGLAALLVAAMPLWLVALRALSGDRPRRLTVVGTLVGLRRDRRARPARQRRTARARVGRGRHPGRHDLVGDRHVPVTAAGDAGAARSSPRRTRCSRRGGDARRRGGQRGAARPAPGGRPGQGWWALAYLILVGSLVAFTAFVWLTRNAPLSLVSTYAYVNPVVAVLLGWLFLAEPLTAAIVAGGALAVLGVAIVVRSERR